MNVHARVEKMRIYQWRYEKQIKMIVVYITSITLRFFKVYILLTDCGTAAMGPGMVSGVGGQGGPGDLRHAAHADCGLAADMFTLR